MEESAKPASHPSDSDGASGDPAPTIDVISSLEDLEERMAAARAKGQSVGLVPTMGSIHDGHRSLVQRAREETGFVVATLYVNPLQFGADEDLDAYPRSFKQDIAHFEKDGVDLVFAPRDEDMYNSDFQTRVEVAPKRRVLCDAFRPSFLPGVTTELARLFGFTGSCTVYLGEKDYQQAMTVRQMLFDLHMPLTVRVCPTIRAADGLALSSRNEYLSLDERAIAPLLYAQMRLAAGRIAADFQSYKETLKAARQALLKTGFSDVQYFELLDEETLDTPLSAQRKNRLFAAVFLGKTRLIDNVPVIRTL